MNNGYLNNIDYNERNGKKKKKLKLIKWGKIQKKKETN